MDVDAVVTWVDGADSAFRARFEHHVAQGGREYARLARPRNYAKRFADSGELVYCLRSILHFAPWIRTIWVVTDDQFPGRLDEARLPGNVKLVSHRQLFRGHEEALPVFNSCAIESMLHRIEGLAEHFLYFNDDFFLLRPAAPEHFFGSGKIKVIGRWKDLSAPKQPEWLLQRRTSAALFGFEPGRVFLEEHAPYPMRRSLIERIEHERPGCLLRNLQSRFRDNDGGKNNDVFVVSALYHYLLRHGDEAGVALDISERGAITFDEIAEGAEDRERSRLNSLLKDHAYRSACFNSLSAFMDRIPETREVLERICGPRLGFER